MDTEDILPAMDPSQSHAKQEELISRAVLELDKSAARGKFMTARSLVDGLMNHVYKVRGGVSIRLAKAGLVPLFMAKVVAVCVTIHNIL